MEKPLPTKPMLGNRYQLQQTIGTGGMAVVYQAIDKTLERQVAVKLLRQRFSRDESFRRLFHQEAKAAANLTHQNIVTVYDFGLDKDRLYIVMEYVPGTDLKSIIREQKQFTIHDSILLITQACLGIGYAHRAGLVHCDVKPHNMLVTPSQRLKVTDFGIARIMATIKPDEQHDVVWGSPQYFSPEQAAGEAPLPASDVYSLGVILYETLTGHLPFESTDADELVRMHCEDQPIPPTQHNPDISPALEQVILKVLSKNPSSRYSNADQMGRVLLSLNRQGQIYASTPILRPLNNHSHSQQNHQPAASKPYANSSSSQPNKPLNTAKNEEVEDLFNFDFLTLGLGILAALFVGGLVPFWLYVWLSTKPPTP